MSRIAVKPGEKYGYLTIIEETLAPDHVKSKNLRYFLCRCECGVVKPIFIGSLRSGATVSCGCYHKKQASKIFNGNPVMAYSGYSSWTSMLDRCRNPKSKDFADYGGRGITVCERWSDPVNFAADMGERPKGFTIDRIDNSRGYSPDNCRWASKIEQARNKRSNRMVDIDGKELTLSAIWQSAGIKESTFYNRLKQGMSVEEATTKPVRARIPYVVFNGEKMTLKEAAAITGLSKYVLRQKILPDLTIKL